MAARAPTTDPLPDRPVRAPDVKPGGQMSGTGFERPQWLIQRGDRYLQVSELLYRIAGLADGTRTPEEIAVLVAAATRRNISGSDVRELIATKLMPSGIVAGGMTATPSTSGSPLAIALRATLIGPRVIDPLARLASVFFFPGVAIAVLAASIATRVWLYGQHGVAPGIDRVLHEPSLMVLIGALAVAGAAFHELGHAAALRVAGGRARGMGVGLYFVYPVFYTDVTDSYRLGRWRRILTDLGGFHFNLVFALFLLGAYVVTRDEAFLVAVSLIDIEIIHQMLPLGRLDGYWLLADLTGVPDFFSLSGPYMKRLFRRGSDALPALRPVARLIFGLYLAVIGPVLVLLVAFIVSRLPLVAYTALDSFLRQAARFDEARAAQDLGGAARAIGEAMLLTLPLLAIAFFLATVARSIAGLFLRIAGRTRGQRLAGAASAVAAAALVIALWAPLSSTAATVRETATNVNAVLTEGVVDPTSGPTLRLRLPTAPPAATPATPVVTPVRRATPAPAPTAVADASAPASSPVPASSAPVTSPPASSPPATPVASPSAAPSPTASSTTTP
jgi:putative peptide zinc metalloprotease protein